MALVLQNVCKSFENSEKDAVNDINLTIEEGEFVCLVGPSGCGKSTILNMIAGLLQPSSGELLLDGEPITGAGADRGMMFQDSALFPWLSVIDNVKFGMQIAGLSKAEQEEKAMHYLKMVKLDKFREYAVHELSGGMRQRVALARALALDSKLLLMDEPFSALDKQTTNILRGEVARIWSETKKTIVLVTHSVEEAVFFADKVAVFSANPGSIKRVVKVDLPRPRVIDDEKFVHLRHMILNEVRSEVEKSEEKEFNR